MANIFKDKYGTGHKVRLKNNTGLNAAGANVASIIRKEGIAPESVFELYKGRTITNLKYDIDLKTKQTRSPEVMLMKKSGTLYRFTGSKNTLEKMFEHAGDGTKASKSDTNKKTECQELVTLHLFEAKLKHQIKADYDYIEDRLPKPLKQFFNEEYYHSAQAQLALFEKKYPKGFRGANFIFELQLASDVTKKIYNTATKLAKLPKDNWNPADMWIVAKDLDYTIYEEGKTIDEINAQLIKDYKAKKLVGISLKLIQKNQKGVCEVVNLDPKKEMVTDLDLSFSQNAFSGRTKPKDPTSMNVFRNSICETKSGFAVRLGYKAGNDLTNFGVFAEGRFKDAGAQVGAVDAKALPIEIKRRYGYDVRKGGIPDLKTEEKIGLKEIKECYDKQGRKVSVSPDIQTYKEFKKVYDDATDPEKRGAIRIASLMYVFLVLAQQKKGEFEDFMKWNYLTAKKITGKGGLYVLLKG